MNMVPRPNGRLFARPARTIIVTGELVPLIASDEPPELACSKLDHVHPGLAPATEVLLVKHGDTQPVAKPRCKDHPATADAMIIRRAFPDAQLAIVRLAAPGPVDETQPGLERNIRAKFDDWYDRQVPGFLTEYTNQGRALQGFEAGYHAACQEYNRVAGES